MGMVRVPKKALNARSCERHISHYFDGFIVRYGNTKYSGVYPGFIEAFSIIADIKIATCWSKFNVYSEANIQSRF